MSAESLRDLLPLVYAGLLGGDQRVRAAAIRLWAACAAVAEDAIPDQLTDLAEVLLTDQYLIVVRAMLDKLPALRLPARLAPRLLPLVATLADAYADDPEVLDNALTSLRHLALRLDDDQQTVAWQSVALALVDRLSPYDRERMLTWPWPPQLRNHPAWTRAALGAIASPELIDRFNRREDELLGELADQPAALADVPIDAVIAVADARLSIGAWRALEPVELLQMAGRWADAHTLAGRILAAAAAGREGDRDRDVAGFVELAARLADLVTADADPNISAITGTARDVQARAADLASAWHVTDQDGDRRARQFLASVTAPADAVLALLESTGDPAATADALDAAARSLLDAAGRRGAPTAQRNYAATAWQIAAHLYRYDAAVRHADPCSSRFLQAAQRGAQVLRDQIDAASLVTAPRALIRFCTAVENLSSPGDLADVTTHLVHVAAPIRLLFLPPGNPQLPVATPTEPTAEPPYAVCVAGLRGTPITDVLVVRPNEIYHIDMTVRLSACPPGPTGPTPAGSSQ